MQLTHENHPLRSLCRDAVRNLYGSSAPVLAASRLEEELGHILRNGFAEPYLLAALVADKARTGEYALAIRGSAGASFVAYLLGITGINPLPAHYRCPSCHYFEWMTSFAGSGFDLPHKPCPGCGKDCKGDGHNISYEMFLGIRGDKAPNIDIDIAKEFEECARNELDKYANPDNAHLAPDLIVSDYLSILQRMGDLTGVSPSTIPMNDPKVLSLFRSTVEIGVTPDQIKSKVATYGIPEMGIVWVREMLELTQLSSFSELIQISGLSHGNGTWEGNALERIRAREGLLLSAIGSRDQLMAELIDYGVDSSTAFAITDSVRKGKGIGFHLEAMLKCNVPEWYIESCRRIKYLFPKSHAVSYVITAVQFAFYKLYYPLEFYAAYFAVRGDEAIMELCSKGREAIIRGLEEADPEGIGRTVLELALELTARRLRVEKSMTSGGEWHIVDGDNNRSLEIVFN